MERKQTLKIDKNEAKLSAVRALEKETGGRVTKIGYIGGGSFGRVFKASLDKEPRSAVVKCCLVRGMCGREAEGLRLLGADSLVKIPEVYFTSLAEDENAPDIICMEPVPGTNCFTDFTKLLNLPRAKARFADEVTSAIRLWHEKTNDVFGLIDDDGCAEWLDHYCPFADEILSGARTLAESGGLDEKTLSVMERAHSAFDFIFSEKVEKPGLIHGDLNVMNVMTDHRLRNVAVIDPLDSRWADPEYELFQLRNLTGDLFGLYDTYKAKYPVSEKCDLKTAFYGLYHEIYSYIVSGNKFEFILRPLVRRMEAELDSNGL